MDYELDGLIRRSTQIFKIIKTLRQFDEMNKIENREYKLFQFTEQSKSPTDRPV